MYVNKCTKCGSEFETKNPKRVICPNCLYPDKKMILSADLSANDESGQDNFHQSQNFSNSSSNGEQYSSQKENSQQHQQFYTSYSHDSGNSRPYNRPENRNYSKPQSGYNQDRGGYQRPQGSYQRPQGGYNQDRGGYQQKPQGNYSQDRGGYQQRPQGNYSQDRGGYQQRPQGNYNQDRGRYQRPQGGFSRPPQNRFKNRPPMNRNKTLLVSKEQLEQIELLYKVMLPLPNPDIHEVIGEKIGLEPRKVFFGINLIRQKMMLPKLPFPKRKLAISPDQMFAIQNLYEPLLPLPPIGCHKIIAAQLKMDEWRVHVGIGLIRAKMGLDRWNQERADAPEEFKNNVESVKKTKKVKESKEVKEKPEKEKKTKKAAKDSQD